MLSAWLLVAAAAAASLAPASGASGSRWYTSQQSRSVPSEPFPAAAVPVQRGGVDAAASAGGGGGSVLPGVSDAGPASPVVVDGGKGVYFAQYGVPQAKSPDPCYDQDGRPRRCASEFGNVALGRQATATSTCGNPPSRYCSQIADSAGRVVKQCQVCDGNNKKRSHPPAYLVDVHQDKPTCWMSATFVGDAPDVVNVTVSLGKKYEVNYVVLPFCNKIPESMALYKSADFGRTWVPLQYYSSQCRKVYGVQPDAVVTRANEQEAVCRDVYGSAASAHHSARVAFSFVDGRPSANNQENSPVIRDWMTLTDLSVVFRRLHAPGETADRDNSYYSLSEITVGGRCKCNGHASRCLPGAEGRTVCDCKHNTDGDDCERCKPFHYDRPWDRATSESANECVACNCNLHSNQCQFNKELFLLSGRLSGGVCINCRHNTAGRNCHYCAEGFHRDYTKPMNHRKACKECKCHPYGSVGKSCNQSSGQCFCKEGVMGLRCDRCKQGYIMTRNPVTPCEKENTVPLVRELEYGENSIVERECGTCRRDSLKLDMEKYCRSTFALQAQVTKREDGDDGWARFTITIYDVYKRADSVVGGSVGSAGASRSRARRGEQHVYVREIDLACKCPRIRVDKLYLMVGTDSRENEGITLDRDAIVVPYEAEYERRLRWYMKEEKENGCFSFRYLV